MKTVKKIVIALMLVSFVAAISTSCSANRGVCQAKKIGNHR